MAPESPNEAKQRPRNNVGSLTPVGPDYLTGGIQGPEGSIVCTLALTCGIAYHLLRARRKCGHCPSGVETSVPVGGLNSNIDTGTGPRV